MYSLPSASQTRAPFARAKKRGWPPTALKARTGLLTPPGMTFCARSKSCWERVVCCSVRLISHPVHHVVSMVREDEIGAGAAHRGQILAHDPRLVDPAVGGRGLDHSVLTRDVVAGQRQVEAG